MFLSNNTLLQGGKYKIIRHIKSGGFGNAYEGIHLMMDTHIVIKEFFPKAFCNRDEDTANVSVATQGNRELVAKLRDKFYEEAKAIFKMKHDHIVRVIDIFEENGTAYYVMDYIDGKSINDLLGQNGKLPEAQALKYIRQIADALRYVHLCNRLHLDVKPSNIMVDSNDNAILIDFGASKHYDDASGENTSTLMGINTKGYAPIEQTTQSFTSFSPATDIYALGATLYKMLSGITPPDANLLMAEEETLSPLPSDISSSTKCAIQAAMSLKRKERPQSIDEFLRILDSASPNPINEGNDDEETILDIKSDDIPKQDHSHEQKPSSCEYQYGKKRKSKILIIPMILALITYLIFLFFVISISLNSDSDSTNSSNNNVFNASDSSYADTTYIEEDNYSSNPSSMDESGDADDSHVPDDAYEDDSTAVEYVE